MVLGALASLSACAPLSPARKVPVETGETFLPGSEYYSSRKADIFLRPSWRTDKALEEAWWGQFRSDALSQFEAQALAANADLKAAQSSVRAAWELYRAQSALFSPNVQLAAGGNRARTPREIASPLSSNALTYTLYSTQLSASMPVDVSGGLRAQTRGARAQAEGQKCLAQAVKLNLTASVAQTFILIASLNSQTDAADSAVKAAERVVQATQAMKAEGEASDSDLVQAEAALAGLQQSESALARQRRVATDQLAVLIGRRPETMATPGVRMSDLALPTDLPISVPGDVLRRRPDVCAAEAGVKAAGAFKDAAVAARLPSFTIGAASGYQSTELVRLLDGPNALWSISASAAHTLFDGGVLRHRARAAEASLEQAMAQHRSTVLAALQSVADALQTTASDAAAHEQALIVARASERLQRMAEAQMKAGQVGRLATLNAEIARRQSDIALIQVLATRELDTVALFAALGGGNAPNSPMKETKAP